MLRVSVVCVRGEHVTKLRVSVVCEGVNMSLYAL